MCFLSLSWVRHFSKFSTDTNAHEAVGETFTEKKNTFVAVWQWGLPEREQGGDPVRSDCAPVRVNMQVSLNAGGDTC